MRGRPDDLLRAQRPVLSLLLGGDKADGGGHHGSPLHARWLVSLWGKGGSHAAASGSTVPSFHRVPTYRIYVPRTGRFLGQQQGLWLSSSELLRAYSTGNRFHLPRQGPCEWQTFVTHMPARTAQESCCASANSGEISSCANGMDMGMTKAILCKGGWL